MYYSFNKNKKKKQIVWKMLVQYLISGSPLVRSVCCDKICFGCRIKCLFKKKNTYNLDYF